MNTSQKYKDTISRSIQIPSGSPAVYQLTPKKEKLGNLTRMTFGQKNPNKTNKTILLVGETGAGKSTLINALINYSMGVKWEDKVWFQIVEEEKRSQIQNVIVYEIFGFGDETLPYSLTIIDIAGFGNIRHTEHEDITVKLFDLFQSKDEVHEVHAVGLVMKASVNRLTDRQRYIFDSVMSLFGKNMEENITALITYSDGVTPEDALEALEAANIKCARNEKNQPLHFLFNNQQNKERTEGNVFSLENAWRVSERGIKEFTAFLEKSKSQKLQKTTKVLNERVRLTACIQNLQEKIKQIELKQTEIRQIQEALKKHEEEMKNEELQGLKIFNEEDSSCGKNCSGYKKTCYHVFKRKKVYTVQTEACPACDHMKEKWKYETETKMKNMDEMKVKYEKNKSEHENKSRLLENLEKKMNQLTAEKSQFLDESYQHVVTLEQIALKPDSGPTVVHLDFLIEKMKEKGDTEKVRKLEEMRSTADEEARSGLRRMFGNPSGAAKPSK